MHRILVLDPSKIVAFFLMLVVSYVNVSVFVNQLEITWLWVNNNLKIADIWIRQNTTICFSKTDVCVLKEKLFFNLILFTHYIKGVNKDQLIYIWIWDRNRTHQSDFIKLLHIEYLCSVVERNFGCSGLKTSKVISQSRADNRNYAHKKLLAQISFGIISIYSSKCRWGHIYREVNILAAHRRGGGYFPVKDYYWGCAAGLGRIFTSELNIMGLYFKWSY